MLVTLTVSLVVVELVSLIIGLPCFLMGCDLSRHKEHGWCPVQNVRSGTMKQTWVSHDTCQGGCMVWTKYGCAAYYYYDCYHARAQVQYQSSKDGAAKTCSVSFPQTTDVGYAIKIAQETLGAHIDVFVNQQGQCEVDSKQMRDVWITGVAFLSVASLTAVLLAAVGLFAACRHCKPRARARRTSRQTHTTDTVIV
jgi:hypothetical protein